MTDIVFKSNADQLGRLYKLAALSGLAAVDRALGTGAVIVHREAVRLAPKAEGSLFRNIQPGRVAMLVHTVTSSAPHAGYVEDGTGWMGKNGPPRLVAQLPASGIAAIAAWIKRKGIVSAHLTPQQLPYAIARRIAQRGTKAQPYMAPALEARGPQVRDLVNAALLDAFRAAGIEVS